MLWGRRSVRAYVVGVQSSVWIGVIVATAFRSFLGDERNCCRNENTGKPKKLGGQKRALGRLFSDPYRFTASASSLRALNLCEETVQGTTSIRNAFIVYWLDRSTLDHKAPAWASDDEVEARLVLVQEEHRLLSHLKHRIIIYLVEGIAYPPARLI